MVSICFRAALFLVSITSGGHASRVTRSSGTLEDIAETENSAKGRRDSLTDEKQMIAIKPRMNGIKLHFPTPGRLSSSTNGKNKSVSFVDEACSDPIAQTCNGICFRVPSEEYFHNCLMDSWAIAKKIMNKPVVSTKPCHDLKLMPIQVLPFQHPTRDACYGGRGSQVGLWTNDFDSFWKASDAAFGGNGLDENDCADWMARMYKENKECLPEGFVPLKRDAEGTYEPVFETKLVKQRSKEAEAK